MTTRADIENVEQMITEVETHNKLLREQNEVLRAQVATLREFRDKEAPRKELLK